MRILTVAALMLAVGCSGSKYNNGPDFGAGGGGGGGMTTLKPNIGLDLTHIVGFGISGKPTASRVRPDDLDGGVTQMMSTLFAIDDQGNLIETHVTSFSGNGAFDGGAFDLSTVTSTSSEMATAIYNTPKYVLFGFSGLRIDNGPDLGETNCGGVIMRKSDGALFCFPPGINVARIGSDGGDRLFVFDTDGVIGNLVRVDMSSGTPTSTSILDTGASDFTVNSDADALVSIGMPSKTVRVIKSNGGLQNLLADTSQLQWLATSGHDFYYVTYDPSGMPIFDVNLATRQTDGSFVVTTPSKIPKPSGSVNLALATATNAYGWETGPGTTSGIMELLGANQGTVHAVSALNAIVDARGVGSSIYVQGTDTAGNGGIVRVDVPAFTQTTLLKPGDFSLTAISVSATGELTFAALRNSDGAHVVGNVAAGASTYTILSATAPVVTALQRIN